MPSTVREFTIRRSVAAAPEAVYAAWTDPERLDWFFSEPTAANDPPTVDATAGGVWRQLMVIDEDDSYLTGGRYRLLVPGQKIVFVWGADGGWPELDHTAPTVTVTLSPAEGGTALELQLRLAEGLSDDDAEQQLATGMEQGWGQTLDRLVAAFA